MTDCSRSQEFGTTPGFTYYITGRKLGKVMFAITRGMCQNCSSEQEAGDEAEIKEHNGRGRVIVDGWSTERAISGIRGETSCFISSPGGLLAGVRHVHKSSNCVKNDTENCR